MSYPPFEEGQKAFSLTYGKITIILITHMVIQGSKDSGEILSWYPNGNLNAKSRIPDLYPEEVQIIPKSWKVIPPPPPPPPRGTAVLVSNDNRITWYIRVSTGEVTENGELWCFDLNEKLHPIYWEVWRPFDL